MSENNPLLGVNIDTSNANTYGLATRAFVYEALSGHNTDPSSHSFTTSGYIREINGQHGAEGVLALSSILILGDDGNPQFQIFADGTTVFNGVTSHIALTDGESSIEKAERAYALLQSCSANWQDTYIDYAATAPKTNAVNSFVTELSSDLTGASTFVRSASASITGSIDFTTKLSNKILPKLWNEGNKLADVETVHELVSTESYNYRGCFSNWTSVPSTIDGYEADTTGSKTPVKNDIIDVMDASELFYSSAVNESIIGSKLKNDIPEVEFEAGRILSAADIDTLRSAGVNYVALLRNGQWRFIYTGVWATGGKNKWIAQYRVTQSTFSSEQMSAINSGINVNLVEDIKTHSVILTSAGRWNSVYSTVEAMSADWTRGGGVIERVNSVYSTVSSTSAHWETVSDKLDLSSINYYSEAMWEALTHDDTSYTDVPYGFSLIYEDTTSQADPAYYGLTTGILLLSDSATFSAGELTFGNADTFNTSTGTFTVYGSSINLGTFFVENYLTHAYNLNTDTLVNSGDSYAASIIAENGYYLDVVTCTMGGISQPFDRERRRFDIASVTGNIVITATGAPTGGSAYYYVSSGEFILPTGTSYLSSTGLLTFSTSVEYVSSTGIMTLNGAKVE